MKRNGIIIAGGLVILALGGCAVYQPLELVESPKLASSLELLETHLDATTHQELPASWREHPINVADGLDETETIILAVLNSPQLKASRVQLEVSRAALYAAGLLPDPQFSTSLDFPGSQTTGLGTGESFALGINMQQILTRGARRDAASGMAKATFLNVLWQEWQVIQQARLLWRRAIIQQRQQQVLQHQFEQAKATWQGQRDALSHGNTTVDQEGLSLAPAMDAQAAFMESKRQLNLTLHDLNLLLGIEPTVQLVLTEPEEGVANLITRPLAAKHLQAMLVSIGERRPDLLALQAGYKSQDSTVREQILSQFPSFSIGANSLRDTSGLWTLGPFINLSLPLLNGNRGNIAVARATRKRLGEEYHFQLSNAYAQASKMAQDQQLAFDEWQALSTHLPHLALTAQRMARALAAGEIDMLTFTTLRTAYFSQQARVLTLEQALLEQSVALDTLTGMLLPNRFVGREREVFPSIMKNMQKTNP